MIALIKRMLEKRDIIDLRGEPWLFHLDEILDWPEFRCILIPKLQYDDDVSIAYKFACWVRNGERSKLMDIAAEANSETMLAELEKNYIDMSTIKKVMPGAAPQIRAFGLTKSRVHFDKTGAGVRVMLKKKHIAA